MLQISEIKRFHQLSIRFKKIYICAISSYFSTLQQEGKMFLCVKYHFY